MDALPTSSSVAKTPAILSSSSSGTVHSRLTVSNSNSRRLRALSRTHGDEDEQALHTPRKDSVNATHECASKSPDLPLYAASKSTSSSRRKQFWSWIVYGYSFCSVAFLTAFLLRSPFSRIPRASNLANLSPADAFSLPYRLSKIMPVRPEPVAFYPFALEARRPNNSSDVTVCAWTDVDNLKNLATWAKSWSGPISMVVVANSSNGLHRFQVHQFPKSLRDRLNVHFLQIAPNTTHSPNSFLNLARMFSRTRLAVLFPGPLSQGLPSGSYANITIPLHIKHLSGNGSKVAPPMVLTSRKFTPTIAQPFERFTPLLVDIKHPVWCTERFFTAPSREDDWEECLWQFWVNSYGAMKSHPEVRWTETKNPKVGKGQTRTTTDVRSLSRYTLQIPSDLSCISPGTHTLPPCSAIST